MVIILLGTNDALDVASGFPSDVWPGEGCGTPDAPTLYNCSFASDFEAFVSVVRGLGRTDEG